MTGSGTMMHVPFIVEGLDDRGDPSGRFLVVLEAALLDVDGREIGRFRSTEQDRLWQAVLKQQTWKLKALKTAGEPRSDLTGDFVCDE